MRIPKSAASNVRSALRRPGARSAVSYSVLIIVLVFAVLAIRSNWRGVHQALSMLRPSDLVLAELLALAATGSLFQAWACLMRGLSDTPIAGRELRTMFFCSQLGKYVPGSVWPALIQAEIGRRNRLSRAVIVTAYALALLAGVAGGGLFSLGVLTHRNNGWITIGACAGFAGGALLMIALSRRSATNFFWGRLLRSRLNTSALESLRNPTLVRCAIWTVVGWAAMGLHAWAITRPLGATAGDATFISGAFALAWTVGLLAVPLPAGAGLREVVLVVTVGALIGHEAATSMALVSRAIMLGNDLVLSLLAGLPSLLVTIRNQRLTAVEPGVQPR